MKIPDSTSADAKRPVSFPPCNRQAHWFARPFDNNWPRLVTTYVYGPIFNWDKLTDRRFPVTNCSGCRFCQLCSAAVASCRQGSTTSARDGCPSYDKLAKRECQTIGQVSVGECKDTSCSSRYDIGGIPNSCGGCSRHAVIFV